MVSPNRLAAIGQLVGDPTRAAMITALMDGRALTASELARCANITPQTASSHLSRLTEAELLRVEKQGRHRYHRLASAEVAQVIEDMMALSLRTAPQTQKLSVGTKDVALRTARTCYDHFAGKLGVAITDALLAKGVIEFDDEAGSITERGQGFLVRAGIDPQFANAKSRRPICRPCLDWTERRPHVAGKLGAAICSHFLERHYVRRLKDNRAVTITPAGQTVLRDVFGIGEV